MRDKDLDVLAELLELLYSARTRFSSVRASCRYSYRPATMEAVAIDPATRNAGRSLVPIRSRRASSHKPEAIIEEAWLVQWHKPTYWRLERRNRGEAATLSLIVGDRWWYQTPLGEIFTNAAPPGSRTSPMRRTLSSNLVDPERAVDEMVFLDPSTLLSSFHFQVLEQRTFLGREVLRVLAIRRPGRTTLIDPLFWGAGDEYELLVDRQRGILLRYESRVTSNPAAIVEVNQIVFDEELVVEQFEFPPSDGRVVHVARDR